MATRAMLSAKTYTASMSALAQKLAWREVIALFASMKEQSTQADAYSFSVVTWQPTLVATVGGMLAPQDVTAS